MIRKAFEKIEELVNSANSLKIIEIGDRKFSGKDLNEIHPPELSKPDTVGFTTLSGIVDFIKDNIETRAITGGMLNGAFVHIVSPTSVLLRGENQPKNFNSRFCYAQATVTSDTYRFGIWQELELFIISLQSMFVQNDTVNELFNHLGNLANEHIETHTDDGVSYGLQIKTGITTKLKIKVKNPLLLQPYRTFREIAQPESNCIIRIGNKAKMECALHIADGDVWKIEAIQSIKEWLHTELGDDIVIMA